MPDRPFGGRRLSAAAIFWLLATIPVFVSAASLSRAYIATDRPAVLVAMLVLYGVGNLMMAKLMRESGLGLAIAASSVAQLVLVGLVAVVVFGERPAPLQLLGMALGAIALALMMWPARTS